MYSQRTNYMIVGAFVTAMLVAALVWLVLLTGRTGPRDTFVMVFENVADVKFGTQVRYEGFPVGEVEAITPMPDGARMRFRVQVSVHRGWRIPGDSVARVTASSFLAAKTIDIKGGDSPDPVAAGGEIATAPAGDMFATMATAAGEITELNRKSIRPLLDTLTELAGTLADGIIASFDAEASSFYEKEDRERGYIEVENRRGDLQRYPILSISIGVASTTKRKFTHYAEVVAVAAEMKEFTKRTPGSVWAADRRTS